MPKRPKEPQPQDPRAILDDFKSQTVQFMRPPYREEFLRALEGRVWRVFQEALAEERVPVMQESAGLMLLIEEARQK